jgi:hopanoid-associated phosphorylase
VTLLAVVGLIREARIVEGPGVRVVIGGGRSDLLTERLRAALDGGARGVISIGLGGGLDPTLRVGDVVIAESVLSRQNRRDADPSWTARIAAALPQALVAPIYGADVMVVDAQEKARLRTSIGAAAVDMESGVAAGLALDHAVRFAALRVISDRADTSLPSAVLLGIGPDGSMNLAGVLGALARDPRQLPALLRAGRDADQAFKVLARVRAALGPDLSYPPA